MNQRLAGVLSASSLLLAGCGYSSYEARLEATEQRIQDEMLLNQTLAGPVQGEFASLNVYLRPPQGLSQIGYFFPVQIPAGMFDLGDSFMGAGGTSGPPTGPYQLHVLARREAEQKQDQEQEKEQPEPEPAYDRGDFMADVRQVLQVAYGADAGSATPEPVNKTVWPRSDSASPITYQRMKLTDPNGMPVHVYLYHEESSDATYDAALIWEFPAGDPAPAVSQAVDMTLGTFAVSQRAARYFRGETDEGAVEGGGGETGAGGDDAVAF